MSGSEDPKAALLVNDVEAGRNETGAGDGGPEKPLKSSSSDEPEVVVTGWRKYFQGKQALVGLYSVALLIAAVGNSIFFKKMTNHMPNYPYFLTQVTTLVYIPIFFGVVAYEMAFTNYITPEMRAFPKLKFLWMGVFDALAGIFMVFGGVHTSGSTQQCLLNAVIPVTMVASYIFLKARYKGLQYIGAGIILGGVLVVVVPGFFQKSSDDTADYPLFNIIFLLNVFPQAMSAVYKEIAFNDIDLDVNYLQAWVALWQLGVTFLLLPLNTLKFLGQNSMAWDQLPNAMWNGARCFAGYNSLVYETPLNGTSPNCLMGSGSESIAPCDDCVGASTPLLLYLLFNCFFNVFIVLVIKYGGAALMYIIMTIRLPLVQIAFSIRALNNPPDPFEWYSILGLFLILGGLVSYRYGSAQQQKEAAAKAALEKAASDGDAPQTPGGSAIPPGDGDGGDGDGEVIVIPSLMGMGEVGPSMPKRRTRQITKIPKKTANVIRSDYYSRLGLESPRGGGNSRLRPGGYSSSPVVTKSSPRSAAAAASSSDRKTKSENKKIEMSPRDSVGVGIGVGSHSQAAAGVLAGAGGVVGGSVASDSSGLVIGDGHTNAGLMGSSANNYQSVHVSHTPNVPSSRNPDAHKLSTASQPSAQNNE